MGTKLPFVCSLLAAALGAHAQVVPLLSNMQAQEGPGTLIGPGVSKAVRFSTGAQTLGASAVTLSLDFAGGGEGVLGLWQGETEPQQLLASRPIPFQVLGGNYSFEVPNVLAPAGTYWLVVGPAPGSMGTFEWRGTSPPTPPAGAAVTGAAYVLNGVPDPVANRLELAHVCYANCDSSTAAPVLNVADFTCFLQRFAAGDCYANCDAGCNGHCTGGVCFSVVDFTCFLQRYAAGCP